MTVNKLKLNHNKTAFFISRTTQGLTKLPPVELKVGNDMIKPSSSVRNLGIIFDNHMSMTQHINSLISSVNFHLRNIRRIAKYLKSGHKAPCSSLPNSVTPGLRQCTFIRCQIKRPGPFTVSSKQSRQTNFLCW